MSYICPKCGLEKDRVNPPSRGNLCTDCAHYRDHLYYEKAKIKGTTSRKKYPQKQYETPEQLKERRKINADKYKARTAVGNAIRDGRIIKGKCKECGVGKVEAHHPDYSKPLEVIWVCAKHHKQLHPKKSKYMDNDYSPFDHGTQTKQIGDKFYKDAEEVLLSDSEKFESEPTKELRDEDNIPY